MIIGTARALLPLGSSIERRSENNNNNNKIMRWDWFKRERGTKVQANMSWGGLDLTSFGETNQGSQWLVKCGVGAWESLVCFPGPITCRV